MTPLSPTHSSDKEAILLFLPEWRRNRLSLILRSELVDSEFWVEKQLWVFGFRTGDQRWLNQLGVCSRWVEGVPVDYKEPASMDL